MHGFKCEVIMFGCGAALLWRNIYAWTNLCLLYHALSLCEGVKCLVSLIMLYTPVLIAARAISPSEMHKIYFKIMTTRLTLYIQVGPKKWSFFRSV